jgi:hypothetical protein
MEASGQPYDVRLGRWVARLPGVLFPCVTEEEHTAAAEAARVLLAA